MTDKERLEEIKNKKFFEIKNFFNVGNDDLLDLEDVNWLIEQAGKREYWMKQHRKRVNELEDAYFKIQLIEKQLQQAQAKAERYKHALEFYADEDNYFVDISKLELPEDIFYAEPPIVKERGIKARKALEG